MIVILFFNKPTMTARCLASARAAGTDAIIMVDNGSSQAVECAGAQVVRLSPNQGFARGMNAGLKAAFSSPQAPGWVTLLSNDIELPLDYGQALAQIPPTEEPTILCPHVYHLSDRAKPSYTHGTLELASFELSHGFDPNLTTISFPAYYPAAATVWNRAAFEKCGGFNEEYFCYWEDVELSSRCKADGVRLLSAPTLRVHHLGRGTTKGKKAYSEHFRRGKELTLAIAVSSKKGFCY